MKKINELDLFKFQYLIIICLYIFIIHFPHWESFSVHYSLHSSIQYNLCTFPRAQEE